MDEKKKIVQENYGKIAKQENQSCCCQSCGCGSNDASKISKNIGYSDAEMESVPEGSNLGLGCGNPIAFAEIKPGDTVLDLGSGAGFDCFLAAKKVGETGKVIGVDMTPEMIERATANAQKSNCTNVEFRQGDIEDLPVVTSSIDMIISNCVINLSPNKETVFAEAARVLKNTGKIFISDIVLLKPLPEFIAKSDSAYSSCIAGAILKDEYLWLMNKAGFSDIKIIEEKVFPIDYFTNSGFENKLDDGQVKELENSIVSIKISAEKFFFEFKNR